MALSITGSSPASGPCTGGTVVTVTGTGFTGGLQIEFDGTPVLATVESPTQAHATTPAHAVAIIDVAVSFLVAHAVQSLAAVAGDGSVDLSWATPDNAADAVITGYRVYVSGGGSVDLLSTDLSTTITGLTDGILYSFTVVALTAGGEGDTAGVVALPVDTTPPVITEFTLGTPVGTSVPVTLTATDNVGPVEFVVDTSATPPSPGAPNSAPTSWVAPGSGTYTLYAHVRDLAENWTTESAGPVTIDVTAPVVTAFAIGSPTVLHIPITTLTDDGTGTKWIVTDGTEGSPPAAGALGWQTSIGYWTTNGFTFGGAGTYSPKAYAQDAALNVSAPLSAGPVTVVGPDIVAPDSPVITVPAVAASTTISPISVTGHDAVGVADYCIKDVANGASAPTFSSGDTWTSCTPATSLSLSGLSATAGGSGARDFYVALRDAAGNISAASAPSTVTPLPLLIPADAADVAHVLVHSGALVDTKGNTWAMQGTVPMNAAASIFGQSVESMGPFSDANYYSLGTGSDVLDFTGDFIATTVLAGNPTDGVAFVNLGGGNGYQIEYTTDQGFQFTVYSGGSGVSRYAGTVADAAAPHVFSFGRAGSTYYMKLDDGTVATGAVSMSPATTAAALIGRHSSAGYSWPGKIYEMRFTTATPSAAVLNTLHEAIIAPALLIPAHSAEVSHIVVQAGGLIDTKVNTWTRNGTVPAVAAASLGFANGKSAEAFGPFSDTNYLSLGTGSDVLDFASGADFCVTFVAQGGFDGSTHAVLWNASWSNNGWILYAGHPSNPTGIRLGLGNPSNAAYYDSGATMDANVRVFSVARNGSNVLWKVDGAAVVTLALTTTIVAATGATTYVGKRPDGSQPWAGKLFELRAVAGTFAAADLDALHVAIRGA